MDGIRSRLGGTAGTATWIASILFFALAGSTALRGNQPPAAKEPPPPAAAPVTSIPAAALPQATTLQDDAEGLRASYDRLIDRGRELQTLIQRASVEDLEDPNGEYQRRMREYGRMWSSYQSEAQRVRRRMTR
jgi:hypothetical protein